MYNVNVLAQCSLDPFAIVSELILCQHQVAADISADVSVLVLTRPV